MRCGQWGAGDRGVQAAATGERNEAPERRRLRRAGRQLELAPNKRRQLRRRDAGGLRQVCGAWCVAQQPARRPSRTAGKMEAQYASGGQILVQSELLLTFGAARLVLAALASLSVRPGKEDPVASGALSCCRAFASLVEWSNRSRVTYRSQVVASRAITLDLVGIFDGDALLLARSPNALLNQPCALP